MSGTVGTVWRRTAAAILALALLVSACASDTDASADSVDSAGEPAAAPAPDPTATSEPDPTATAVPAPEPTATATPEPEPDPTTTPAPEPEPAERAAPVAGDFSAVDAYAEQVIAEYGLEGASLIVVDRDDGVIHNVHYGTFEPGRISMIASSSKMISAGVLVSLQEQGLLAIDEPLADQVDLAPDYDITPAQLVSNTSGLVGLGPNLFYTPYFCQWTPTSSLDECGSTVLETPDDDGDIVAPEAEFRYGGAQWQVAGAVAEAASGKTWAQLIDEIYVEPCGVDSLGYLNLGQVVSAVGYPTAFGGDPSLHDASANPSIEGGAHITTDDYATLLLMHLRDGECPGGQVLTADGLAAMHNDRLADLGLDADDDTGYGLGWWVDRETGIISDGGAWGALPWLNLAEGYGAYWLIEDDFQTTGAISEELIALVHGAVTGEDL